MSNRDGVWVGVDLGSLTTKLVALTVALEPSLVWVEGHEGRPIQSLRRACRELQRFSPGEQILGVGTTGSGRTLARVLLGADLARNEITAHAKAALHCCPEVRTIIEIGGQDSKVILLRQGVPVDFAMNSVCAAGTGSFLEQQARRLGIEMTEFGPLAVEAERAAPISGRCVVFSETDMIHKQQMGVPRGELLKGLARALVRNYLNSVARGRELEDPILFQGGVAANEAIRQAFSEELGVEPHVPDHHQAMGAIGAALLVAQDPPAVSAWRGADEIDSGAYRIRSFLCDLCPELCEVVRYHQGDRQIAFHGNRCERWSEAVGS